MDKFEKHVEQSFRQHGWTTHVTEDIGENLTQSDIVAYKPTSRKMFYGNLTDLCHHNGKSFVLKNVGAI